MEILNSNDFEFLPDIKNLTKLEQSVLNNNLEELLTLLQNGSTIYLDKTNKLCTGYIQRKCKIENHICIDKLCSKSSVYYALFINHGLLRLISCVLKTLQTKDNLSEKILSKINEVSNYVNNLDCSCKDLCMNPSIYVLNNEKTIVYGSDIHIKLTEIVEYLKEFSNKSENNDNISIDLYPEVFEFMCIKSKIQYKSKDVYSDLVNLFTLYDTNLKILRVLLNQQAYEQFKHILHNTPSDLINKLQSIYNSEDIDINYANPFDCKTVLLFAIYLREDRKLIEKLIELGCKLPTDINTIIVELLNQKYYTIVELLLNTATSLELSIPNNVLHKVIKDTNMDVETKENFINCICHKDSASFTNDIVLDIINCSDSIRLLNLLSNYSGFMDNFQLNCISRCIGLGKYEELDILLSKTKLIDNLINGSGMSVPLFMYFNEISSETDTLNTINILKVLLKYKPNINIIGSDGNTPLLRAIKDGRYESALTLLNNGADPFIKDKDGDTVLHVAINNNNIEVVRSFYKFCYDDKYLVNEVNKYQKTSFMLALDSHQPFELTQLLLTIEPVNDVYPINLNVLDEKGMGVLDLVIMNDMLDLDTKMKLFNIYFSKGAKLTEVNKYDFKPLVVRAVEYDLFDLVVLMMNKLIKDGDIDVSSPDIISGIKNNSIGNIIVRDKKNPNYYSLVIMYIKQNIQKILKPNKKEDKQIQTPRHVSKPVVYKSDSDEEVEVPVKKILTPKKVNKPVVYKSDSESDNEEFDNKYDLNSDKHLDQKSKNLIMKKLGNLVTSDKEDTKLTMTPPSTPKKNKSLKKENITTPPSTPKINNKTASKLVLTTLMTSLMRSSKNNK
jgi:hypothetical protein